MNNTILITDSLFIFDEHIEKLKAAGYQVERLDRPNASAEELKAALSGKVGYILGGVERVTTDVIESTEGLKVIACTVADWQGFIPGWQAADRKGIAISNIEGAFTDAVAELALTLLLFMLRDLPDLSSIGTIDFKTVPSIGDVRIGIVGLGRIGGKVASLLRAVGAMDVVYWDRQRKEELEQELGIRRVELSELMSTCDVVTNHLSSNAGMLIDENMIRQAKDNVIFINAGAESTFDYSAVAKQIISSNLRIALDLHDCPQALKGFPVQRVFRTNVNTGFNTHNAIGKASDMATVSIINLLSSGQDKCRVN